MLTVVIIVVAVALIFDYTNGFHDAANAIATSVSTRALTPRVALIMAAVFNFIGAFVGQKVATTVSETIDPGVGRNALLVVLAGLVGAIVWNVVTWYFGMPSSSSHALIGGLVGAALVAGRQVHWQIIGPKVLVPMVLSPIAGFVLAFALTVAIAWALRNRDVERVHSGFRLLQTVSAAALALGHGLQDAQKTMGVIVLALVAGGVQSTTTELPLWVVVAAGSAIALGTYSGGWRIMRTLGQRIIHLTPARGFAAETTAAGVLYFMALGAGAPVSTTHTITSAIMGAGSTHRFAAVRWLVVRRIVTAWILTFPLAAIFAAVAYLVISGLAG
ncbi:MAG TPA: inorganic phosphate transporter [Marmoricola sp.]|nr:inorganic phosphate transporter [Marmoricola sp.]